MSIAKAGNASSPFSNFLRLFPISSRLAEREIVGALLANVIQSCEVAITMDENG